jgi:hypothetical protein
VPLKCLGLLARAHALPDSEKGPKFLLDRRKSIKKLLAVPRPQFERSIDVFAGIVGSEWQKGQGAYAQLHAERFELAHYVR